MNPWTIAKLVGVAAICFWAYHLGGLSGKAQVAALQASQSAAVSKALQAQAATTAKQVADLQGAVAQYEQQLQTPNPIDIGLAHRVYLFASASCPTVPKATTAAPGTSQPSAQPTGTEELERLAQAAIDACAADAEQLSAIQQAWPR